MPIRHYAYPTKNRKNIKIRDIDGIPDEMRLKFQSVDIRYHQSQMQKRFFFCTVHLPNQKDNDGYDLELEVMIDDLDKNYNEMDGMIDNIPTKPSFKKGDKYDEYHELYANDDDYDTNNYYDNDEYNFSGGLYDSHHYEVQLNDVDFKDLGKHTKVCFEMSDGYLILKIKIIGTSYQGMVIIGDEYFVFHK